MRKPHVAKNFTLLTTALTVYLAVPGLARAANYTICIRWQAQTLDSCDNSSCGIASGPNAGGHEDAYIGCNGGCTGPARGVRVTMTRSGWEETFDANPSTGCFSFTDSGTTYTMWVHGRQTNAYGSYARIHNQSSPGSTLAITVAGVTPTHNGSNTYDVGSYDRKWTAMLALGYGIYVWASQLVNKAIHAGLDENTCGGSSAHFPPESCGSGCAAASCDSNAAITLGHHNLRFGAKTGCNPQASMKFVVAHELGHAIAALRYGGVTGASNGGEPCYDGSNATTPNSCGTAGNSYSMGSKEWNNVGFREGFAHFMAARVWNRKDYEGAFWLGSLYDLERYNFGAGTASGGRLENECCTSGCSSSWANAGTNEDWMRFFWDWYTNLDGSCPYQPDGNDMVILYILTRLNGGLTAKNYFSKMQAAAEDMEALASLPECLVTTRFNTYAVHNGINN